MLPLAPLATSNTVRLLFASTPGSVGALMVTELRATVWLSILMNRGVPPPVTVIGLFTVNVLPTATMSGTSLQFCTTAAPVAPLRLAMTLSIRKMGPMVPMLSAASEVVSAIMLPWKVSSAPFDPVFPARKNRLEPMDVL